MVYINTCSSCIRDDLLKLKSGEPILLSGCVYTDRDAAHKRMFMAIDKGEALPFPIKDSFIYYAGPTAARPGTVIGSCLSLIHILGEFLYSSVICLNSLSVILKLPFTLVSHIRMFTLYFSAQARFC